MKANEMNLMERIKSPTPKFFRKLRNIGLILGTTSAAILAMPVALPVALLSTAGYLAVAGGVVSAISQTAVDEHPGPEPGK